jgi:hypothetical protein
VNTVTKTHSGWLLKRRETRRKDKIIDYEAPVAKDINLINYSWLSNRRSILRVANLLTAYLVFNAKQIQGQQYATLLPSQADAKCDCVASLGSLPCSLILQLLLASEVSKESAKHSVALLDT